MITKYNSVSGLGYWSQYYLKNIPPSYPSQFAVFAMNYLQKDRLLVELGCGSGRDSIFFRQHLDNIISIDGSAPVIEQCLSRFGCSNPIFICCEARELHSNTLLKSKLVLNGSAGVDFYARFFFHAVDDELQTVVIKYIGEQAVPGSKALFEFRTNRDEFLPKHTSSHYRRFIDVDSFCEEMFSNGFLLTYRVEGVGFAKWKEDDAHVARLVFVKDAV